MQPNIIKMKSPLELILHFADDEICHVIGEFKFPVWIDPTHPEDGELVLKLIQGIPSKMHVWTKGYFETRE